MPRRGAHAATEICILSHGLISKSAAIENGGLAKSMVSSKAPPRKDTTVAGNDVNELAHSKWSHFHGRPRIAYTSARLSHPV